MPKKSKKANPKPPENDGRMTERHLVSFAFRTSASSLLRNHAQFRSFR
jgi:hypothetical protein